MAEGAGEVATVAIDAHPIEGHRLLTAAECVDVVAGIDALRAAWAPRGEAFFSLGSAGYLDAVASRPDYLAGAVRTNPPLRARFGALYARVCRTLSRRVGAPVTLADDLALPGFHVFEFDGTPLDGDRPSTRAHFDLQWLSVLPGIAPDATLSFTVLLETPSGGAALELWPLDYADAPELEMSVPEYAATHVSYRWVYALGELALHDGLVLHAIGTADDPAPVGRRITLQGHGVRLDGTWSIYW